MPVPPWDLGQATLPGAGREVCVTVRDIGVGRCFVTFDGAYDIPDFSGFDALSRFEMPLPGCACHGPACGVMLARGGLTFQVERCVINRPKDRGLIVIGFGRHRLFVKTCPFLSNASSLPVRTRSTVAMKVPAKGKRLHDHRVGRFALSAPLGGGPSGDRQACLSGP
ncbi:MAG: hypothetical protein RIT14_759 [Pseudomonadota bacterium]|jgi:hypothetical protein